MYQHRKVYVACGLTHAPQSFKDLIEQFKEDLRSFCEVLCFFGCGKGAASSVIFNYDVDCALKADLVVAVTDENSTGMGIELGFRLAGLYFVNRKMPILAVASEGVKITDMVNGAWPEVLAFRRYNDLRRDVPDMVKEALAAIEENQKKTPERPRVAEPVGA